MFAHNGYWLHPAHCQLFSVHVTTFLGTHNRKILVPKEYRAATYCSENFFCDKEELSGSGL